MILRKFGSKIITQLILCFVLFISTKMEAQSCYSSTSYSACCNQITFSFNPTFSYQGNTVVVQFNPTYNFSTIGGACRLDQNVTASFLFGDSSPMTSAFPFPLSPITHSYVVSNGCNTTTFQVKACLNGTTGGNEFTCEKDYTLTIAPISTLITISALNVNCKTFTLNYTGGPLSNVQWNFGDATFSPIITTGSASIVHTYPTSGSYVITLFADGIMSCPAYTQVSVSDFISPDFSYTVVDACDPTAGVILAVPSYTSPTSFNWQINNLIVPYLGSPATYTTNLVQGNNTIKLLMSNNSGCNSSVSKYVTIGNPNPNFTVFSNSLCAGDMLSPIGVPSGADLYTWNITKPGNIPELPIYGMNPNYIFNSAGVYTISLVLQSTITINDVPTVCTNSSTPLSITVSAIPNATFSIPDQQCNGSVTLNIPNSTFTSYSLSYGLNAPLYTGGSSIPVVQTSNNYTANGLYNISLDLSNNGCNASYNENININNLATLTISPSSNNLCAGGSVTLVSVPNAIPNNAGPLVYSWTGPGAFTSAQPNVVAATSGTYQLVVSSTGVCPVNLTSSISILGLANPIATVVAVDPIDCNSSTGTATLAIPIDLQIQGYCINNNCTPANPNANAIIQVPVSGIVVGANYLIIANGLDQSCSNNILITGVQNNPTTVLSVTQPNNCNPGASGSANLTVNPNNGFIIWYNVNSFPNTVITTGNSASNLLPGSYVVQVIDGFCSAINYFTISLPVINLTKNGAAGTCSPGAVPITINAQFSPNNVSSPFTYSWNQVTGTVVTNLSTGSSNVYSVAVGVYSVDVTAANGCSATIGFNVDMLDPITINLETILPTCKIQGVMTANASGGDGNFNYAWFLNSVQNGNTTNQQSLNSLVIATTISVQVSDQSGCFATAPSSLVTIMPPSVVTLSNCSGTGSVNATNINGCDISTCLQGGLAPYTYEWFKLVTKRPTITWNFFYNNTGTFVATNGTQTFTVTIPTSTANLATLNLNNTDSSDATVSYPFWTFTTSPAQPILTYAAISASITNPSTNTANYFTVNETVLKLNQEDFVDAYSGPGGVAHDNGKFTTGDYNLHVTDANGCKYKFNIGNLIFTPPTTFPVTFEYVWGIDKIETPPPPVDVVLLDDMIEASNALLDASSACMQKKQKQLNEFLGGNCGDLSQFKDALNVEYELKEHHYTLYYYDRAGQLTKTVPPEGVEFLSVVDINQVKANRTSSTTPSTWPTLVHRMTSKYQYNSFGQLLSQNTPDGGTTNFIYDSKNRLRFSQNDKQAAYATPAFSYTKYDELGRIIEVGETTNFGSINFATPTATANVATADNSVHPVSQIKQVTKTFYSQLTPVTYYGKPQQFLQNRVSQTLIDEDPSISGDEHLTTYSYDSHGNVEWLVQDHPGGIGKNYVAYEYDLVSGKVLKVKYNEMRLDRFYHKYGYDAENRLVSTQTSHDGELWDEDSKYTYYPHGPLKRNVIGEDHVQGLDYIYTIHGWMKSLNSPSLIPVEDPGGDNNNALPASNNPTDKVAADRHGMILNYYTGDYTRTGNFLSSSANYALTSYSATDAPALFNGNISSWVQSQLNTVTTDPMESRADLYKYDLLNRIKVSTALKPSTTSITGWENIAVSNSNTYKTGYSYDANGNILTLQRYDNFGNKMDELEYTYDNGAAGTASLTNKLSQVNDIETSFLIGRGDLESSHTYTYDAIGNLIGETGQERINPTGLGAQLYTIKTDISWTVYGKIKEVLKTIDPSGLNRKERITFAYDASGNRIKKEYWKDAAVNPSITPNGTEEPKEITTTYYVRDAQGNTMSTYQKYFDINDNNFKYDLIEQPIYGSDRVGQSIHKLTLSSNATYSNLALPSSGVNVLSEYQNWITGTSNGQLITDVNSGTLNNLCQCKIVSLSNNTVNPNPNYETAQTAIDFLGIANNGIAHGTTIDCG